MPHQNPGSNIYGDPAKEIATAAAEIGADLVVIGHHKQGLIARWWNGSVGANLLSQVSCSLLIAQPRTTE